ncbi:MAG TPA: hypothetical protein P5067_10210, partial [Candidatus Marinimicrobia bacterium]|nr:hypothetical protein [Candidatus Neomarinimicrobiota bacterium]HRS52784.1 hypothetical protein [Candidatus Neomarinimicrobiota bacterium]
RKTYLGVSISGTTLSFSSEYYNFTLTKQTPVTAYDASVWNGTWKVTSTTNSSSSSDLILNEILTFSNSTYNGTEVSGEVVLVSISYGSVNGTYVFNPTCQTLIITYTKSPNRKTYLGVSISGTTLSFSSAHDNFTLKKQ